MSLTIHFVFAKIKCIYAHTECEHFTYVHYKTYFETKYGDYSHILNIQKHLYQPVPALQVNLLSAIMIVLPVLNWGLF